MLVLGVNAGPRHVLEDNSRNHSFHDCAAALVRDGEVIAAVEQERLDRVKHSNFFPADAIRRCLELGAERLSAVDAIAVNWEERRYDGLAYARFMEGHASGDGGRGLVADLFAQHFGIDLRERIRFVNHHLAHAWSAFAPSGFEDALIAVLDGSGDDRSGLIAHANGEDIEIVSEISIENSLGELYARTIRLLGYGRFDEYKAMGLAPYGDPARYADVFRGLYTLLPEGAYRLLPEREAFERFASHGLIGLARTRGEDFRDEHKDIAAALQASLERIVLHVLTHHRTRAKSSNLCLAGGVAHNCTLNGKLLYSGLFDRVYVQPAAHDAGGALGAAYALSAKTSRARPLRHVYLGTDIGGRGAVERELRRWSRFVEVERMEKPSEDAALALAEGAVIAWVEGRAEFGPRALGNRSILADPRPRENKRRINAMVKKREGYRPFAPSVLHEDAARFFELPEHTVADLSCMLYVVRVRDEWHQQLGAITHVDGTARIQTVSRELNPQYWALIHSFGEHTGIPIVLNTSFNNNVEPIVDTVDDAVACFLTTNLDALVVGGFRVERRSDWQSAIFDSGIQLMPERILTRSLEQSEHGVAEARWTVGSRTSVALKQPRPVISDAIARLLTSARSEVPLRHLTDPDEAVRDALLSLWSDRIIRVVPG